MDLRLWCPAARQQEGWQIKRYHRLGLAGLLRRLPPRASHVSGILRWWPQTGLRVQRLMPR